MNQDPGSAVTSYVMAVNELTAKFLAIESLQPEEARNTLLHGLPGRELVSRGATATTDLINITWHAAEYSMSALQILCNNVRFYVPEDHQREEVTECLDALEQLLALGPPGMLQEVISRPTSDIAIPFVNRDAELRFVLTERSPTHHVLDGPAGYGKTRLLEKLEGIFGSRDHRCVCARVSAKDCQTMVKLVTSVCEKLDLDPTHVVGTDGDVRKTGVRFGHEIMKAKFSDLPGPFEHRGVVLLLDDIGAQSPDVSRELLEVFIPAVEETLRTNKFFSTRSNAFRVVVCGRYLAHFVTSLIPKLPWELSITTLKPFDYKVVWDTARMILTQHEDVEQTAAHILHLTGGHPHCMAQVLNFYREHPCKPETFLQLYSDQIWDEIVSPQVKKIHDSIPSHLRSICDRLSIFRVFNCRILRQLMEDKAIHYRNDEFSLHDELAGTHVYDSTPVRYAKGAIVGRMLVLQLRHSKEASQFAAFCSEAHKMCLSLLETQEGLQDRDLWTVECLFQALQEHAHSIRTIEQRLALRESFFEGVVPEVLDAFMLGSKKQEQESDMIDSRAQKQELDALGREMSLDRNWDFRFNVNYCLRGEFYSEDPFTQLVDVVRSWRREESGDAESRS